MTIIKNQRSIHQRPSYKSASSAFHILSESPITPIKGFHGFHLKFSHQKS